MMDATCDVLGLDQSGCKFSPNSLVVIPNLTLGGAPYALIENVVTDSAHGNRGHDKAILKTRRRRHGVPAATGNAAHGFKASGYPQILPGRRF